MLSLAEGDVNCSKLSLGTRAPRFNDFVITNIVRQGDQDRDIKSFNV